MAEFVPPDFEVPPGIETSEFVLEPLGPEHNDEMAPEENRADLERHAEDSATAGVSRTPCSIRRAAT